MNVLGVNRVLTFLSGGAYADYWFGGRKVWVSSHEAAVALVD